MASVERFGETRDSAAAGESIGITLCDVSFADRGSVICTRGKEPALTGELRADIFWMARAPYAKGERLAIRCATQETTCRVTEIAHRLDSSTLETLETDASELRNLEVADVAVEARPGGVFVYFSEPEEAAALAAAFEVLGRAGASPAVRVAGEAETTYLALLRGSGDA